MGKARHIDDLLREWPYRPGAVDVRLIRGRDGRDLLQMRLDMGVLQLEVNGRPDGQRPEGFDTYYDYMVSLAFQEGEDFVLDEQRCSEIDREFVQFYHRRICWLTLGHYQRAVIDADHTLALMDFSSAHASDENWVLSHEQYRPFVIFHRTQAVALAALDEGSARRAIEEIQEGLERMRGVFAQYGAELQYEDDELVGRLVEFKESLRKHYEVGPTLAEQLAEAVAAEQYELAARLRDEMERRARGKRMTNDK